MRLEQGASGGWQGGLGSSVIPGGEWWLFVPLALIQLSSQALVIFFIQSWLNVCVVFAVFCKGSLVLSCVRSCFSGHEQAKMGYRFFLDAHAVLPRLEHLTA